MASPKSTAIMSPNMGLYFDRPPISVDPRALQDGLNFRVKEGRLQNLSIGWARFQPNIQLNGPVLLINDFFMRGGEDILILGTATDLYRYSPLSGGSVHYITPTYNTGLAAAAGTAVTGSGTAWSTTTPRPVEAGDEIFFGSDIEADPNAAWHVIQSVNSDTSLTLAASAGTVSSLTYTIRLKFRGDITNIWSYDTFLNAAPENEDEWFATNGIDLPVFWNGTGQTALFLNNNFTAKSLRVYSGVMCYFNIVQGGTNLPTTMISSDAEQPKVTNGTGLSTQLIVHSDAGEIYNSEKLGSTLVVYSKNVVTLIQFTGDTTVFVLRQISFDKGVLAPRAFSTFPSFHEYLGPDTMYHFDGATISPVNTHVFRQVLSQQDPVRAKQSYAIRDEQNGEVFWVIPSTVDPGSGTNDAPPSQAFVEHYLEQVGAQVPTPISKRTFPFTATGSFARQSGLTWDQLVLDWQQYNFRWNDQFFAASFSQSIGGDVNGKLYVFNGAQDADGVALPSFVKFGRRATYDGRMRALVTRVYPFAETFANPLLVTVNLADYAGGPAVITAQFTWDQSEPEGLFFTPVYRVGRYIDLQFGTAGPTQPWVLDGYDMDIGGGGNR